MKQFIITNERDDFIQTYYLSWMTIFDNASIKYKKTESKLVQYKEIAFFFKTFVLLLMNFAPKL